MMKYNISKYAFNYQLHNHMPQGMEVFYHLGEESMGFCGELQPGAVLNLPMRAVHSEKPSIFFKPMVAGYDIYLYTFMNNEYCKPTLNHTI